MYFFFSSNKFQANLVSFSGYDPESEEFFCTPSRSECEEWLLLVDQSDHSPRRAVIIKNKNPGRFLAIQDGGFTGLESYNEDCKWFLD